MKRWLRISIAFCIGLLVYTVIRFYAVQSYNYAVVEMESSVEAHARIYTATKKGVFQEKHLASPYQLIKRGKGSYKFYLRNAHLSKLRFDPGQQEGIYTIYSITLLSFFSEDVKIIPQFQENNIIFSSDAKRQNTRDSIQVISHGPDPYIVFSNLPSGTLKPQFLWTIFCAALLTYVLLPRIKIRECLVWQDTFLKCPSSGKNLDVLDGLRGFAALWVFCEHTGIMLFTYPGAVGVTIFFVLSGFLLALPFAADSTFIFREGVVTLFFLRRLKRIFPMFCTFIFIAYLFNDNVGILIRSLLFLEGSNVLWTVLQEVHFYTLLPLLLMLCSLLCRGNIYLSALFFLGVAVATQQHIVPTFQLYGNGNLQHHFVWIFCGGVIAALIYQKKVFNSFVSKLSRSNIVGSLLLISILSTRIFNALITGKPIAESSGCSYYSHYYILVSVFVFYLAYAEKENLLYKLFTIAPLRILGTVSYSFYILHPACLQTTKYFLLDIAPNHAQGGDMIYIVMGFTITLILSILTYTFIERPFLVKK